MNNSPCVLFPTLILYDLINSSGPVIRAVVQTYCNLQLQFTVLNCVTAIANQQGQLDL